MPQKLKSTLLPVLGAATLFLQGCATVTTGSSQSITLETLPDGAKCLMEREGETVGAVSSTPGTVSVSKDMDPIQVRCEKPGHQSAEKLVESTFQGATLGNIILGGVIGIAIDAGSGAANKYPENLFLVLAPEQFESEQQKQDFFSDWRDRVEKETQLAVSELNKFLGEDDPDYKGKHAELMEVRQKRIDEIDAREATARVRSPVATYGPDDPQGA